MKPHDLRYAKTHEWARIESAGADKVATIGVSDFALEALTDLVFVELPAVGKKVQAGQPFGEIESVKAVSDLYSPVGGEVTEVNSKLADRLESLNADPYDGGWMIKLRVDDPRQVEALMTLAQYEQQCAEDHH